MYYLCKGPTCALKEDLNSHTCRSEVVENQTQNLILWLGGLPLWLAELSAGTYGLKGRSPPSADSRREDLGLVYGWFCIDTPVPPWSGSQTHLALSCSAKAARWDILKKQWKEVFPVDRAFYLWTWLIIHGRRNGQTCGFALIHEPWPMVWLYGWELGRNIIGKIGNKDIWGRVVWTDLSKWVKNIKIFFYPMWMFPKGWPQRRF